MRSIKRPTPQEPRRHDDKLAALLNIGQRLNAERDLVALLDLMARGRNRSPRRFITAARSPGIHGLR